MNNFPLISVIVPIYNTEHTLERCVNSIVSQTYSNLEILLVDDGSPDNCPQICDEFAVRDGRIRVIHKKNGGVSSARNAGLDIANGKYISFVDSDDYIENDMIQSLYENILAFHADISVCGYYSRISLKNSSTYNSAKVVVLTKTQALQMVFSKDGFKGFLCNKLFSASFFHNESAKKLRLDENIYYCEDMLCTCQCILKSQLIAYDPAPKYHYINNLFGTVNSSITSKKLTVFNAFNKLFTLIEDNQKLQIISIAEGFVDINVSLLMDYYNCNYNDIKLVYEIKKNVRAFYKLYLFNKRISLKHKTYVTLIAISPKMFIIIWSKIKSLKKSFLKSPA